MKKILITGGCGFIGSNAAVYFFEKGWDVSILDNLSRSGTQCNKTWLETRIKFSFYSVDIRNYSQLSEVIKSAQFDFVLHLAGQVAVTTSVVQPREDFDTNALGTFNILEAIRIYSQSTFFLFASTNKVYGKMDTVSVEEGYRRYAYIDYPDGVDESFPLDFHSPYGCSKGSADQYALDYARIYGLNTVCFRQSCIYGERQFGIEDQGWIAWFIIASTLGKKFSIYGDGKQVRDALWVGDLVQAYELAYLNAEDVRGQAFNIGGGIDNTLSLLELIEEIEKKSSKVLPRVFEDWRPGDQKVFICNVKKFEEFTGWAPKVRPAEGISRLFDWVSAHQNTIIEALKK